MTRPQNSSITVLLG